VAARGLDGGLARAALVHLQRAAVDPATVAVFALRVRFFQRQGYDAAAAVSSGAIASTASWTAKALLFLVAIGFSAGTFQARRTLAATRGRG
jgi:hypothetical protein